MLELIREAEKRIKRCKNCGRYFVIDKDDMEYCDRIAAGETKPCGEIGKSRTYERKIAKGGTAMQRGKPAFSHEYTSAELICVLKNVFTSML